MKKLLIVILLTTCFTMSYAGFNGRTQHSRANCVNNETITWDATRNWTLFTRSYHYHGGFMQHVVEVGWDSTWRSAAVHWNEAYPGNGWNVTGEHWMTTSVPNQPTLIEMTYVDDCSIYDGWWDRK